MLLNDSKGPTLENLEHFLIQYPNFQPVLNTSKMGLFKIFKKFCFFKKIKKKKKMKKLH